ncbi:unnamed protein product [Symbiodinium sp. CCMP2456]|nr:unnamed protein product [Symbiodinium sp. CCMP2456]
MENVQLGYSAFWQHQEARQGMPQRQPFRAVNCHLPMASLSLSLAVMQVVNKITKTLTEGFAKSSDQASGEAPAADEEEELKRVERLFSAIDVDGSGELDRQEVLQGLMASVCVDHFTLTPQELASAFEEIWTVLDASNDGKVCFEEFCEAIRGYRSSFQPSLGRADVVTNAVAYTVSTMVFGMICSALGPSIPWLAGNADVSPEVLGWLPAAQAVMCIVSGLASSLMAYVPRRCHHRMLFVMMLWLGGFFALLPVASQTLLALVFTYGFQVLPRPWIGQMTNLLVSELYEDPSLSSAAQSFNQGGFAFGCVIMVLLEQLSSATFGTEVMFYLAGGFTALSSLLFLKLPMLDDKPAPASNTPRCSQMPSCFTLTCSGLGILAVGLEVACGTWLITSMTQIGFSSGTAAACNVTFWILFAVSRLVLAPCICKCLRPRPAAMVIGGAAVAFLSCLPAAVWPHYLPGIFIAVSGVAVGAGPTYAMCISMAKERRELTSVDSAMFAIASSLGAGGVPFVMSRILAFFGSTAFFPTLTCMCLILLVFAYLVDRVYCASSTSQEQSDVEQAVEEEAWSQNPMNKNMVKSTAA